MSSAVAAAPPVPRSTTRGRTRITGRALQRVVAAVAGESLGVRAGEVGTELTDHEGRLDVTIHAPVTVPSIARVRAEPRALERSGGSVLDRCEAAETSVRDRVLDLTQHEVRRVTVRVTDVRIAQERRVR